MDRRAELNHRHYLLKILRREPVPKGLAAYRRRGLLDSEFERPPLPDVVRPRVETYAWASELAVDCGRRTKPKPPLDRFPGVRTDDWKEREQWEDD